MVRIDRHGVDYCVGLPEGLALFGLAEYPKQQRSM
jgi:hypothetical protein